MAYRVWIEGDGPFPILHADPLVPPEQRSGHRGPFADRELFEQFCMRARARRLAAGAPQAAGRSRNSWHLAVQIPRGDGRVLIAALRTWLEDVDAGLVHSYVRSPPPPRTRPGPDEFWTV